VFVIILARFRVPRELQQGALMVGIIVALVLRGAFILAGAAVITTFTWVFYLFGAFLVYTAIKLVRDRGEEEGYEENALIRLRRLVYLSLGLAAILAFIGVKLVLQAVHENSLPFLNGGEPIQAVPRISTWVSLLVIVAVLLTATVASLLKTRRNARQDQPLG